MSQSDASKTLYPNPLKSSKVRSVLGSQSGTNFDCFKLKYKLSNGLGEVYKGLVLFISLLKKNERSGIKGLVVVLQAFNSFCLFVCKEQAQ